VQPVLLLLVGIIVLIGAGACVLLWRNLQRRNQVLEERIQSQIDNWTRECPVEVLGGKLSELPGAAPGADFILMFWNNSGIPCNAVTLRLLEVREGLELKPVQPPSRPRSMPVKLLPASPSADRATARSRPLARMKLAPYERGEVELACLQEAEQTIVIQHEVGELVFPLEATDYEFALELTAGKCRELFTIGIKRLTDEDKWIASLPRTTRKLRQE
jgi:hypothetical protein